MRKRRREGGRGKGWRRGGRGGGEGERGEWEKERGGWKEERGRREGRGSGEGKDCGDGEERLCLRVVKNEGLGVEHLLHKFEDQSSDPSSHICELQVQ